MGNVCHKLKGFLVCNCFVPIDMDQDDDCYNKRRTVTCNNKIFTISEFDDAVVINSAMDDSVLPVGSFGICKQKPADLTSILSTTLTDIEHFRSTTGRHLFQSSSHLNRRMSDTLSLESGYLSITGASNLISPVTLPIFNETSDSVSMYPVEIPINLDQTISSISMASNSPVMTLSKRNNSHLEFAMPIFYEWSKSSLNRLTTSMSKCVLIESMKKKLDKKSNKPKKMNKQVKPTENKESTLVCRTVRLFSLANTLFNAYFMRICDPNFL